MHPSFEQFVAALRDPSRRASIGLTISDSDAASLLTRQNWANDYYHQWLALFPAVSEQTAAQAPAAVTDFGPPPQAVAPPLYAEMVHFGSPSRVPSGLTRLLIIGGSVVGALLLVVVGVSVYSAVVAGSVSHLPRAGSATSASTAPLPDDLHGLSAREYPLMEAVFESEDRTIPGMAAQGMTDDRLRSLTDTIVPDAERACTETAKLQKGFDDPAYRASFIAGYIATSKSTPGHAAKVYDAIADYCAAG